MAGCHGWHGMTYLTACDISSCSSNADILDAVILFLSGGDIMRSPENLALHRLQDDESPASLGLKRFTKASLRISSPAWNP